MQTEPSRASASAERQLLGYLLQQERGIAAEDYALFWVSEEGTPLPHLWQGQGVEEMSGYLVDRGGTVVFFWLGWDAAAQAPALTEWIVTTPEPDWADDPEYQRARHAVGLPLA
jgi:hypothetical protein